MDGEPCAAEAAPLLPIGAVVAALAPEYPDVTPSSLRFLEREGLVVPRRTEGGHRLYTPEHVTRLRRIKQWQRDRFSLAEIRQRLSALERLPDPGQIGAAFLEHALAGEAGASRRTLIDAAEAGLSLTRLFEDAVCPALREVGDRWATGSLSVGQEHEVSALAREVVGELARRLPEPERPLGVVVAACPPGERHDLGLRMAATLWSEHGFRVHFLGADVPVESILEAVVRRRASVLLLSASTEATLPALEAAVLTVATLPEGARPHILAGGQAAAIHEDAVRAHGAGLLLRLAPPHHLLFPGDTPAPRVHRGRAGAFAPGGS